MLELSHLYGRYYEKDLRYDTFYIGCLNRYFIFTVSSFPYLLWNGLSENLTAGQKITVLFRIVQYAFKLLLWITGVKVTVIGEKKMFPMNLYFLSETTEFL